jgi:cysteine-rich secretory family protein
MVRIADVSSLRFDRAGENVAYNASADSAHDALMHSPPHRQNLLDPNFNVAGVAAIWSGGRLYVVEDFARQVPSYSAQQTRQMVGRAINEIRSQSGLPQLRQVSSSGLDEAVCSMSKQNRVSARPLNVSYPSREIITYTQSRPEVLPQNAVRLLSNGGVSQFAIGTCYARAAQYPSGMYWVAILLY